MEKFFSKFGKRNKIINLLVFGRIWNGIIAWLFSLLSSRLVLGTFPDLGTSILLLIIIGFIYMGASAYNDLIDVPSDGISMQFRPLITKTISFNEAKIFILFSFLVGLLTSFLFSLNLFISTSILAFFAILYSIPTISLKRRGIIGNLSLGFITIFLSGLVGYVIIADSFLLSIEVLLTYLFLSLFFGFFSILKDFKDMHGDKMFGNITPVLIYGTRNASIINIIGTAVFFVFSIVSLFFFFGMTLNTLLITVILFAILFYFEYSIFRNPKQEHGEKIWGHSRIILFIMILIIVIF